MLLFFVFFFPRVCKCYEKFGCVIVSLSLWYVEISTIIIVTGIIAITINDNITMYLSGIIAIKRNNYNI